MRKKKVLIFSGAGISAESGLQTFRGQNGLWENYPVESVASPEGWRSNPQRVLRFYNQRRTQLSAAKPNEAHQAIARLEKHCEVVVVTQNVDDLHERAGSTQVLHLHGELCKARSSDEENLVYHIAYKNINLGDKCERGSQLRPHIVWFGEYPFLLEEAGEHIASASHILVVGTSLQVQPAASLLSYATQAAEKVIISLEASGLANSFIHLQGKATQHVPEICSAWTK
ncbi:NAD-dependent deacetylase [Alteromonadaceae bacterium Bs31]|nr:NAD-dependent deacetylase [Alteromonadaceae bacterium Bs31]